MQRKIVSIGHPINEPIKDLDMTPLIWACYQYHENSEEINDLLTRGADPNVTIRYEVIPGEYMMNIPLHWVSIRQSDVGVKLLLDAGADLFKVNESGQNAAHKAVYWFNQSALQVLIDYAMKQGKIESLLLQRDTSGRTPLMLGFSRDTSETTINIADLLLRYKADKNVTGHIEDTALYYALKCYSPAWVSYLIKNGTEVSVMKPFQLTALSRYAESKRLPEVAMLLKQIALFKEQQKVMRFGLFGACKSNLKLLTKNPIFEPKIVDKIFDFIKP